ncbi:MAG: hypothetical protein HY081_05430 [Gammaproteobacteria bacterium]|nr:hypothetical protein [Gammaproteobacteria bacterium]
MRMTIVLIAVTMIVGCGEKKEVKDTVFAPQFKAMEKARAVEATLKQGAEKNQQILESSDKSSAPEQK